MDQVNKDTLISLQVEKAKRFLTQADEMVELKHWDLAANRYYYACFHAVQALFIAKGVNAHTHAGKHPIQLTLRKDWYRRYLLWQFPRPYVPIKAKSRLQLRLRNFRK